MKRAGKTLIMVVANLSPGRQEATALGACKRDDDDEPTSASCTSLGVPFSGQYDLQASVNIMTSVKRQIFKAQCYIQNLLHARFSFPNSQQS